MIEPTPRRLGAVIEPIVAALYFAPEAVAAYEAVGLDWASGYFRGRAAAMGRVPPEVVAAVFYNFNPTLVASFDWNEPPPEAVLDARSQAIRAMLTRIWDGADRSGMARATALLREAADACRPEGRPLYAANARLPWPDDELEALWHVANLLREYRGDSHVAVLVAHVIGPCEALALHQPYVGHNRAAMFATRAWDEATMNAAIEGLVSRRLLEPDGSLTDGGAKFREMLEVDTDRVSRAPADALGDEKVDEVVSILRPLAARVVEARAVPRSVGRWAPGFPVAGER